jgi:hypothetical protein
LNDQAVPPSDESRIRDYLSGRLDSAEAERFEERMFADDGLAAEVQLALEIRAATSRTSARKLDTAPRRAWVALAAAAGVAALAAGIAWLPRTVEPPVFRGAEQRMGLTVEADGTTLRARWQSVADAASYELQVLASDGRVLRSVEAGGTAATLDLGTAADQGAAAAFVEVSALDGLGQTLQRSERVALPDR